MAWQRRMSEDSRLSRGRQSPFSFQQGSISLEASLVLSLFVLAMISWMFIIQLLRIQSLSHHALDQAVMELSEQITMTEIVKENADQWSSFLQANSRLAERLSTASAGEAEIYEWVKETLSRAVLQAKLEGLFKKYMGEAAGNSFAQRTSGLSLDADLDAGGETLTAQAQYQLHLPGMMKTFGPVTIEQTAKTGIWLLDDMDAEGWGGGSQEGEGEDPEHSIWQETAFRRGREFLARRRSSGRGQAIVPGRGFDLFHGNTLEEAVSLNLYSPSYSSGEGLDPANYQLKEQAIEKVLTRYAKKILRDQANYPYVKTEGGRKINTANRDLLLLVILPEEAKFNQDQLEAIAAGVSSRNGIKIQFQFSEKALLAEDEPAAEDGSGN